MSTWTGYSKRSGDVTDADYMARALFHAARDVVGQRPIRLLARSSFLPMAS